MGFTPLLEKQIDSNVERFKPDCKANSHRKIIVGSKRTKRKTFVNMILKHT